MYAKHQTTKPVTKCLIVRTDILWFKSFSNTLSQNRYYKILFHIAITFNHIHQCDSHNTQIDMDW